MTQKTATEKYMFLQTLNRESQTTLKILRAFPATKSDFKPHEKCRSAKELAWVFVQEQGMADSALKGHIDFTRPRPPVPDNFAEIIAAFEKTCRETADKVARSSDDDLGRAIQFPVGPGKMGDMRRMDVLWASLMDQVHHRGQLSVYLRMVGAKVPSIYGPSGDEPWM